MKKFKNLKHEASDHIFFIFFIFFIDIIVYIYNIKYIYLYLIILYK